MYVCVAGNARIPAGRRKTCCLTHCLIGSHSQSGLRLRTGKMANRLSVCLTVFLSAGFLSASPPACLYIHPSCFLHLFSCLTFHLPCWLSLCLCRIIGKCTNKWNSRTRKQILLWQICLKLKVCRSSFSMSLTFSRACDANANKENMNNCNKWPLYPDLSKDLYKINNLMFCQFRSDASASVRFS